MSDIVGAAGVTIEPVGLEKFASLLEKDVGDALAGIESKFDGIEGDLGGLNAEASRFANTLDGITGEQIRLDLETDTTDIAPEIDAAVDAADTDLILTGDATEITGDIDGAVSAADTDLEITGDAGSLVPEIDGAVDAADTDVTVTADAAGVTGAITEAVDAADTAVQADFTQPRDELGRFTKQTEESGESAGGLAIGFDSVKKQVAFLGGTVAGVGLASFFGDAIGASSDLEESLSKSQQVFGDYAGEISLFGDEAATSVGLAKQEAVESTATFGNLFTAIGLGQQSAADMSTDVVQLGADLASFNNLEVDDTLQKIRSGLVGEIEPLRRLGVNFNALQVEAKAVELGLVEQGAAVSEAAKVQARYALITEQTTTAQGDFARTSDGLANQMRILQAEFGDVLAEVGTAFLPTVLELVGTFREFLPVVESVGGLLGSVFSALAPIIDGVLGGLAPVLTEIGGAFTDLFDAAGPGLEALGGVVGDVFGSLLSLVEPLTPIFGILGSILGTVGETLGVVLSVLTPVIESLGTLLTGILTPIIPLLEGADLAIGAVGDAIGLLFEAAQPLIDLFADNPLIQGFGALLDFIPGLDSLAEASLTAEERQSQFGAQVETVTSQLFGEAEEAAGLEGAIRALDAGVNDFLATESLFVERDLFGGLNEAGITVADLSRQFEQGQPGLTEYVATLLESGEVALEAKKGSDLIGRSQAEIADLLRSGTIPSVQALTEEYGGVVTEGEEFIRTFIDQQKALDESATSTIQESVALGELSQAQVDAAQEIALTNDGFSTQQEVLRILGDDIELVNEKVTEMTGGQISAEEEARLLGEALVGLGQQAIQGSLDEEQLRAKSEELGIGLEQLEGFTTGVSEAFAEFQDQLVESIPTVTEAVDSGLESLNTAVDEEIGALEQRLGDNAAPGQLEAARARMEAALRPDFIIDALNAQVEALANYESNIQFLISSGFDDTATEAITRGPEFTNELVAAIQSGRPGLGAELEASFDLFETKSADTETYIRDVAAPALFDATSIMGQLASEGFDINLNFNQATVSELSEADLSVRAQEGNLAAAAEVVARGMDSSFLEGVDFGGTTIDDIRSAQENLVASVPGLAGAGTTAGGATTGGFGGSLDLGGETDSEIKRAQAFLDALGLNSSLPLLLSADAAGLGVGKAFAGGISRALQDAIFVPGGVLEQAVRMMIDQMAVVAIDEASQSPPFYHVGSDLAEGTAMGFGENLEPLLTGIYNAFAPQSAAGFVDGFGDDLSFGRGGRGSVGFGAPGSQLNLNVNVDGAVGRDRNAARSMGVAVGDGIVQKVRAIVRRA